MEEMQKDCLEQSLPELAALVHLTSKRPTRTSEVTTPGKEEVELRQEQQPRATHGAVAGAIVETEQMQKDCWEQSLPCTSEHLTPQMAALARPMLRGTCTSRCNGGNAVGLLGTIPA